MDRAVLSEIEPRVRRELRAGVEHLRILPRRNWKVIGVAGVTLFGAHLSDIGRFWDFFDGPNWVDGMILALFIAGWLFWLLAFASEFFGDEVLTMQRGDLVVSRGIGPLRRTRLYPGRGISELVSDGPATEQEAKPKVHHILFKPKSGAARFTYEWNSVWLGETIDEAGGEAIVRWLTPKLPRRASEMWGAR